MGLRFRRSIKILPGVRLNFSKSGVSATLGGRGASVNVGRRGTYANLGVPGTGVSYRERLDGGSARRAPGRDTLPPRTALPVELDPAELPVGAGLEAEVRGLVPLWPWVTLLVGGLVVAGASGAGAGFGLGLLAAIVGGLAALGVPHRRAVARARLLGLRPEGGPT